MNRFNLLFSLSVLALSCSGQQKTEQPTTNMCVEFSADRVAFDRCCSNHCAQSLAACTERHPGDFSACSQERNSCESTCRGDLAVERMEKEQGRVIVPIQRLDAGTEPDAGADAAESAPESAGETPQ